ncbi:MAG: hypothetical protein HYZ27_06340, partial [Deltaproteobacteria bacterium]|nr:hypothetical protein [Deltaproteobacteria bacterium]
MGGYRDPLSAALARISVLEEEVRRLEGQLQAARPRTPKPAPPPAKGGRRAATNFDALLSRARSELAQSDPARSAHDWVTAARLRAKNGDWLGAVACYDLAKTTDDAVDDPPQISAEMRHALL